MSSIPDFESYTLVELNDVIELVDRERFPKRVKQIQQLIRKRETEGDIVRGIARNQTWLRFKEWVCQLRISVWISKSILGRVYRYIKNHRSGSRGIKGMVSDRLDQWLALEIDGLLVFLLAVPLALIAYFAFDLGFETDKPVLKTIVDVSVLILSYYLLNFYLLLTRSQTVGKFVVGIRIETLDGERAPISRILLLRSLTTLLFTVATLGVIQLVNLFLILRKNKRSIQDYVAKTRLVYV